MRVYISKYCKTGINFELHICLELELKLYLKMLTCSCQELSPAAVPYYLFSSVNCHKIN